MESTPASRQTGDFIASGVPGYAALKQDIAKLKRAKSLPKNSARFGVVCIRAPEEPMKSWPPYDWRSAGREAAKGGGASASIPIRIDTARDFSHNGRRPGKRHDASVLGRCGPMPDFELPDTRYALSGDVNIAYQTMGDGPVDIVVVPGIVSHIEFLHEMPGYTSFLRRLATFARITTFDKRGQGLSDRVSDVPSLEQRVDDFRAVMESIGSQRAVLLGFSEGSPMSAFFAAAYPERVSRLVLFGGFAKSWATDEGILQRVKLWGTGAMIKGVSPSEATNKEAVSRMAKFERLSASPGAIRAYMALNRMIDVASILPTVRVPTLVLHRRTDALVPVERGRELAAQIPEAKYIEYPDGDHLPLDRRRGGGGGRRQRVCHGRTRKFFAGRRARAGDGAVHRHCRFDQHRRRNGRSEMDAPS
jgi:pimeloyl-ACP methyl ester carboxylesterase